MKYESRWLRRWIAAAMALVAITAAPVGHAESSSDRTERVLGLGRVWAKAKFFHPYLAYKEIDWDAALVAAIPKAEAASTTAEYRIALRDMLAALGDPVTRVIDAHAGTPPKTGPVDLLTRPAPGLVEVKIAAFPTVPFDFVGIRAKAAQVIAEAAKAKVLVLDMRTPGVERDSVSYVVRQLLDAFPAIDEWPLQRSIEHHGFRTQVGNSGVDYFSTFVTTGDRPPTRGANPGVGHVVFIVDPDSDVPSAAVALQAAGRGVIVAQGPLNEGGTVATTDIKLSGDVTVRLRLGESLWGPPTADITVDNSTDLEPRALAIARTLTAGPVERKPKNILPLPPMRARDDRDYADEPYPSRERRILAGIRLWAILDTFFPYRYLIADWDGVAREMLPRLAAAGDLDAYFRVLREMGARAGDGHVSVYRIPGSTAKARGMAAIQTRLIEGTLTVVRSIDASDGTNPSIAVGDVVETIDGKRAATVLAERRIEVSGSTEEARDQRVASLLFWGDDGTPVTVRIRAADGTIRERTLTRTVANMKALSAKSTAPHWKVLPGNIGYADLRELLVPEVGPMFEDLKSMSAIVFDMRGYPNGTAWPIAPRVNTRHAKYGAQILEMLVIGDSGDLADLRVRSMQSLDPLPKDVSIYSGKIVVLIDDRTVSQAEHTCLFLESAAGATFIGSPTSGTNGNVTAMRLPGGFRMSFTGLEVRHVDGRQLQKVGIQPDVVVRPTIAGIRAGKDEVLDRALAWLASKS